MSEAPLGRPLLGRLVAIWFALDVVLALAPPLYWAAGGQTFPILGLPAALFYFLAVSTVIAASVLFAWGAGRQNGEGAA